MGITEYLNESIWNSQTVRQYHRGYTLLYNNEYKKVRVQYLGRYMQEFEAENEKDGFDNAIKWLKDNNY